MDVRQLVRWLGVDGARAGMLQSKTLTVDSLRRIAISLGLRLSDKMSRASMIDEIIRVASRKVEKSMDELLAMDFEQLIRYFEQIDVEPRELLDVLKQLDLSPRRESRRGLIELAAREISETGRFQRIAGMGSHTRQ